MAYKLLPEESKPSTINKESIHRLPAQAVAGAAAVIPGFFGDITSLAHQYVANPLTSLMGGEEVPYEQSPIGKLLPTTEQHKKALQEGIPYLKPKNRLESTINDISSDALSLAIPSGALTKAGLRGSTIMKSLYTSLGANAAGEAVYDWTGDEKKAAYTKMGAMFLGSLINKPGINKEISNLYNKEAKLLPATATIKANKFETQLNSLKNEVLKGSQPQDLAPSEVFVIDQADMMLRQIKNGEINVSTLRARLRSLNENLQKAVYEAPNKGIRARTKKLATKINGYANEALKDYGKQNPEWWKVYKRANDAYGTLQQSNFATKFIENNFKGNVLTHGLLHILGIGADIATGVLPYQASKIIYRIAKSPELAKHYARVVSSAASENAPLMNKEIKKLDSKFQEEQKESKYRYRLIE
jgi:hypothetical protein